MKKHRPQLKTAEEIADAIFSHGDAVFSANRFPGILEEEVRKGGHTGDLSHIKLGVAMICNVRRKALRSVA